MFNESTDSKAYKGLFLSAILSLPRAWLYGGGVMLPPPSNESKKPQKWAEYK